MRLHYDADQDPDPADWLALDEVARTAFVRQYHFEQQSALPKPAVHAALHTVIETQVAMGDPVPARAVLARLMAEGLGRHDAIHAIGSVLAAHLLNLLSMGPQEGDPNTAYFGELELLTAEIWRKSLSHPKRGIGT